MCQMHTPNHSASERIEPYKGPLTCGFHSVLEYLLLAASCGGIASGLGAAQREWAKNRKRLIPALRNKTHQEYKAHRRVSRRHENDSQWMSWVPWMSWVGNGCWSAPNVDWSTPNETANMLAQFLN